VKHEQKGEMMIGQQWKLKLYKWSARIHRIYTWILAVMGAGFIGLWLFSPKMDLTLPDYLKITWGAIFLVLLIFWISNLGWYYTWHRYVIYFLSWVSSLIRRVLKNYWVRAIFLFLTISLVQKWIRYVKDEKEFQLKDIYNTLIKAPQFTKILEIKFLIVTIVIMVVIMVFLSLIKMRKRIVFAQFEDHTGKKELEQPVKGIASRLINEINRLIRLFKTIDEIHPKSENENIEASISIPDIGQNLKDVVGPDSAIQVGAVLKIPIGPLLAFFTRWVRGPILSGSLHVSGDQFILMANLKGGGHDKSWKVGSDDFDIKEFSPLSDTEKISKMACQLVFRIFTDLAGIGSPRWEAVESYAEGLRHYRNTVRTAENRQLKLKQAERAFKKALNDDTQFAQCYYALGIVYRDMEFEDSADTAFRKSLSEDPDDFDCYYELAFLYFYQQNYKDAIWFCQQAIHLSPMNPKTWNLRGVIDYYDSETVADGYTNNMNIPPTVIRHFENAVRFSWLALCREVRKGDPESKQKNIAIITLRNLAEASGKNKRRSSQSIFKQALFLAPNDNDLYFELGKYYYRIENKKKACETFKRVFEESKWVSEPRRYWACYSEVCAYLYLKTEKREYEKYFKNSVIHFLDWAAAKIQQALIESQDHDTDVVKDIQKNVNIFMNIKERYPDKKGKQKLSHEIKKEIKRIEDLVELFKRLKNKRSKRHSIAEWVKDTLKEISNKGGERYEQWDWAHAQVTIAAAKEILKQNREGQIDEKNQKNLPNLAIRYLEESIKKLRKEHPKEIKMLRLERDLAEAYYQLANFKKALIHASKAVRLNPFEAEERHLLGKICLSLRENERAREEFEKGLGLNPANIEILKDLGETYIRTGKARRNAANRKEAFEKAIDVFKQGLSLIKSSSYKTGENPLKYNKYLGVIHYYLGSFNFELTEYDNAITHFQITDAMGYESPIPLIKLGWIYVELNSFNKAEQAFKQVRSRLAKGFKKDQKKTKRMADLVEIDLGLAVSKIERYVSIDDESFDREIPSLLEAVQTGIKNISDAGKKKWLYSVYYDCLGRIEFKKGKYGEAVRRFDQSTALMASPRVYYYLAESYWSTARSASGFLRATNIQNARTACLLSQKHDLRQIYEQKVSALLKKLGGLEEGTGPTA
jgi:tetratricopeptide (TPR) repeat protein